MKTLQDITQEKSETYLNTFKCIDSNCDGNGSIPVQNYEGEWEADPCEYCYVVRFPTKELIIAAIKEVDANAYQRGYSEGYEKAVTINSELTK
jgi:hypothetical protein